MACWWCSMKAFMADLRARVATTPNDIGARLPLGISRGMAPCLDTTEAIAINAHVTCDNDSELWKIYRAEGSELEAKIKKIVTEDLGSNFEAVISFHMGSCVARIVVTANKCYRVAIYVINKTIRKIEELLKTFFRKARKVAASVDWD